MSSLVGYGSLPKHYGLEDVQYVAEKYPNGSYSVGYIDHLFGLMEDAECDGLIEIPDGIDAESFDEEYWEVTLDDEEDEDFKKALIFFPND